MTRLHRWRADAAELIRLAAPVVVSRAGILTMALVDTAVVGRYATDELAFLAIASAILGVILTAEVGLLMGTLIVAANAYGAGRFEACGAAWRFAMPYSVALGFAGLAVCLVGEPMLRWSGQEEAVAVGGGAVLAVLGLALPFAMVHVAGSFFLEGIKRPMPGMVMMVAANVANLALNVVLVFGLDPIPAMGAEGSAWATTIVRIWLAAVIVIYILTMTDHARFAVRRPIPGTWRQFWRGGAELRRLGYAAGASIGAETASFGVLSIFAGWISVAALAAHSIALNVLALIFMVSLGIASATTVRVGVARGRGDWAGTALAGWIGLGLNSAIMAVVGVLLYLSPEPLAAIYSPDPVVIALTAPLMAFSATIVIADGGQVVMAHALRGRGDTWVPTVMHMISYLGIMVPLAWALALPAGRGLYGIYEAILVASIVVVLLEAGRFHWLARRDQRVMAARAGAVI